MVDLTRREMLQSLAACAAGAGTLNAAAGRDRVLDAHVHVWTHREQFPFARGAKVPDDDATAETLIALMKTQGVEKVVLVQVTYYGYDNSYLASVLRRYPQFFQGVCWVDPTDPAAPDQLARLTEEQGFRGLRVRPLADASGDWIRGPLMPALWRRCEELRVPMTFVAPISRVPDIQKLVDAFPGVTVVIDHMAETPVDRPDELEKLIAMARSPKVFVKISHTWSLSKEAYPWLDSQRLVKRLYDAFGPKRLLWASDWPIAKDRATYQQRLAVVRDDMTFLTAEDKRWLFGKTAERVWPAI